MKQRDLMTQTTFCWLEKAACMFDINKHSELEVHACSLCSNGDVFVLIEGHNITHQRACVMSSTRFSDNAVSDFKFRLKAFNFGNEYL